MTPPEGLAYVCPSCGASVAPGVKFCGECGHALPAEPAGESRRQVTVLFSDVAGSTQLGERLDAEAVRSVMRRYFALATEAIERHGGTVEKFIGDAVMAVFGLPELHEDDAMRAVRAAVEIRAAVAGLSADLEAAEQMDGGGGTNDPSTLQVRIGVNSGEVVAGDSSARQQLVTGDAVNVAARLEQAASPGEILLGPLTWQLVRDEVEGESISPLDLRGKAEPVAAHRLVRVRSGADLTTRRLGTRMVGRDGDLGLLTRAFEAAVATDTCRLVTIVGAAGIGKSRLTHEFVSSVRDRATVLRGRCLPYGEGITYWPIALALKSAAGIGDGDDPTIARGKLDVFVETLPDGHRIADALAGAIGLGGAATPREETGWAVRHLLESKAAQRPCVMVIDDIQWAEETLLDLLESVAILTQRAPILLLCIARPELVDVRPAWGSGVPEAVTLRLEPLSGEAVAELIADLGEQASLPSPVVELLSGTAEGNPLFLEELMAMLVEDGVLTRTGGSWEMAPQPSAVQVPPTIQALLAARLDRLDPADRAVAQRGAVIGRVFPRGAVVDLSPEPDRARVDGRLVSLVRKEVIRPDTTGEVDDSFRFRHLLVRDAAYDGLPKQERADLHRRFAGWLEHAVGDRLPEFEEIVGHHLERAYWYRRELRLDGEVSVGIADAAARHLAAAAYRALDRSDLPAAAGLLRRALAVMRTDDHRRVELEAELVDALMQMGRIGEATTELDVMRQTPGIDADPRRRAWLDVTELLVTYTTPDYQIEPARQVFERAIRDFERADDVNGLGRAWLSQAHASWYLLQAEATIEALDRALAYARQAGRRSHELSILAWLTRAHAMGPTPVLDALVEMNRIEAAARGDRRIEAAAAIGRAHLQSYAGDVGAADENLGAAIRTFVELDMTVSAGEAAQASYFIGLATGRLDDARLRLELADRQLEGIGETMYLSTNLVMLANLELDCGRVDEAERLAHHSATIAAPDDLATQWMYHMVQAGMEAARGRHELSTRSADRAVSLAAGSDFHVIAGDVLSRAAEVHRLAGNLERARTLLDEARARFASKGATAFSIGVERRLESL